MRKRLLQAVLAVLVALAVLAIFTKAHGSTAPKLGAPISFVSDFAGALNPSFIKQEDKKLSDYQKQTTNEIAVVVINSTEDSSIEEYATAIADQWKPGVKGKDNGVILLIAMKDHHMRIEVGRGLQGQLTDIQANNILSDIKSYLRSGDNDKAVEVAVDEIITALGGTGTVSPTQSGTGATQESSGAVLLIILLVVIGVLLFFAWLSNQDSSNGGGDSSVDSSDDGDDSSSFLTGAVTGGLAGYGLGRSSHSNDDNDDDNSSSSSSGSSGNSDDNSGGSSFGGFSGGSFDGGGASSSW